MQLKARIGRRARLLVSFVVASLLAAGVTVTTGAGTASAIVGRNQITHLYMNLGISGNYGQRDQYQGLINSIRVAASNRGAETFRGNTYIAQYADQGLIRVSLHLNADNQEMSLWLDPQNLYVLGFTNTYNQTWQFNDNRFNLADRLSASGFQSNGAVRTLYFGGAYPSLTASAGVNRGNFSHNYNDVLGSVRQLARVTNPTGGQANGSEQQWTARSLFLMIQMTSEAARFYDINGVFRSTMYGTYTQPGIVSWQSNLENGWSQASAFGYSVTNDPTTPGIVTTGQVQWHSWSDVSDRIAIMLYKIPSVPDGGNSGNWTRDEL
ncbi:ribosome-inactivating family protein [Streptomyces nigra]|uniref:ribosome-inactivating family protein n=1 Tax=Streptomyces nigra TaxID=1827580 RepID=UPI0035E3B267